MVLPNELEHEFKQEVRSYEEANRVRYVTSIERLAKEEMMKENVIKILQTRFGGAPSSVVEIIDGIGDQSFLETLFTNAITIGSIEEFQQLLTESTSERGN